METIGILGLGLMGASLGLALRKAGYTVQGYARRDETRAQALTLSVCDRVFAEPADAMRGAGVGVLCVPVGSTARLAKAARPGLAPGTVMTDVGSTKTLIMRTLPDCLRPARAVFVGSHPMTGSEQQGLGAARADLYRGACVVITPPEPPIPEAVARIEQLWKSLGARVLRMQPQDHDRAVARISHLPHLVSALLSQVAGRAEQSGTCAPLCGEGFRDTSRVAEGSPRVWRDIVETNIDHLLPEWDLLLRRGSEWRQALARRDMDAVEALLDEGRAARRRLVDGTPSEDQPV